MTSRALLAECALMPIILAMTAVTRTVRGAIFFSLLVTARAGEIGVLAFEFKIGSGMVERVAIEIEDIGITAFMIGVALLARQRGLMLELAVKAAFIGNIGRYHIVALHAQLILRLLGERSVTLVAIVLQFRMPLDQFSGHQQRFEIDIVGTRKRSAKTQQQEHDAMEHGSRFIISFLSAHRFAACVKSLIQCDRHVSTDVPHKHVSTP